MAIKYVKTQGTFQYICDFCKKDVNYREKRRISNFLELEDGNKGYLLICPVCTEKIKNFAEALGKDNI